MEKRRVLNHKTARSKAGSQGGPHCCRQIAVKGEILVARADGNGDASELALTTDGFDRYLLKCEGLFDDLAGIQGEPVEIRGVLSMNSEGAFALSVDEYRLLFRRQFEFADNWYEVDAPNLQPAAL